MPRIKICPICGREFESRKNAGYCSESCRKVQKNRTQEEWRKRQLLKRPLVKVCPICGKKFTPHGNAICCGSECSRIAAKERADEYQRGINRFELRLQGLSEIQCAWCGKKMTKAEVYFVDPAEANWIFCSRECAIATYTNKFFAMKDAGIIVDKLDDLDVRNVNVVR